MIVKRSYLSLIALLAAGAMFMGCTSFGVARLPEKSQLFVSTSPEDGFIMAGELEYPYQPLGYLAIDDTQFTPCMGNDPLRSSYQSLEKTIAGKLVDQAKNKMGADGVIGLKWTVAPGFVTYVSLRGLAVKKK